MPTTLRRLMPLQRRASPAGLQPRNPGGAVGRAAKTFLALFTIPSKPVGFILLVFGLFELLGVYWDQPGFYGWENDGAAPRDFFGGIADNLSPGKTHRYPLFHYLLIGLLNLPVLLGGVIVATFTGTPIEHVVLSTPSMTMIAVLTKLLHLAMAIVGLLAAERIWRTLFGARAAVWALLFTVSNLTVAYYARVTNVDIAYLMWVVLAMERILLIAQTGARHHYRWFAAFVAAGLATKDQAYASFVLLVPLYLLWLPGTLRALGRSSEAKGEGRLTVNREHFVELIKSGAWALGIYLVLSGALFNPTGFVARIGVLTGPNSQGWRQYPPGLSGMLDNAMDLLALQPQFFWPVPVVIVAWLGVLTAPWLRTITGVAKPPLHWSWSWFPFVAGLSNTVAFTLVVGRAEHRFMLVLGYWLSGYVGVAVCAALSRAQSVGARSLLRVGAWCLFALGLKQNLELLFTQWTDPRRQVESFLDSLPPDTRVETYGLGVYLPTFNFDNYTTTRISSPSWGKPPSIVGLQEMPDDFRNIERRKPDVLVLPEGFAGRFRMSREPGGARAMDVYRDALGAQDFFSALLEDRLPGYSRLPVGTLDPPAWYTALGGRLLDVHGSTGRPVWVFARDGLKAPTSQRASERAFNK